MGVSDMTEKAKRLSVLILGYGEMGHAMEHLLSAHHQLDIWEKYPQPGFQSVILEEANRLESLRVGWHPYPRYSNRPAPHSICDSLRVIHQLTMWFAVTIVRYMTEPAEYGIIKRAK